MCVLGTTWTTWHSVVGQQACEISHKMDSGMWQTTSKADFLHSLHKRFPTILSCGKHGTALQTGFVSRLRLCWRSWGLKIDLRRCLVYLWKQNICSSQLDVQDANISFSQPHRVWNCFSGCWTTCGWAPCSWPMGLCNRGATYNQGQHSTCLFTLAQRNLGGSNPTIPAQGNLSMFNPTRQFVISRTKTQRVKRKQRVVQSSEVDCPTDTHSSQGGSQLCIFEDNEAVIKMIIKGWSPTMRHVSRTHRVALDWLPYQICWHQKTNSETSWPKEIFHESSSSFVQHHEFLDVLLKPF